MQFVPGNFYWKKQSSLEDNRANWGNIFNMRKDLQQVVIFSFRQTTGWTKWWGEELGWSLKLPKSKSHFSLPWQAVPVRTVHLPISTSATFTCPHNQQFIIHTWEAHCNSTDTSKLNWEEQWWKHLHQLLTCTWKEAEHQKSCRDIRKPFPVKIIQCRVMSKSAHSKYSGQMARTM